eukprot:s1749_g6.t1
MTPEVEAVGNPDEDEAPHLTANLGGDAGKPVPRSETITMVKNIIGNQTSYASLGLKLIEVLETVDSPFGRFIREYSSSQPTPALRPPHDQRGDLLPIAPESITVEIKNVTAEKVFWVQAVVMALNYHYCCGWTKPVCVPIKKTLGTNQREAISKLADMVTRNVITADVIPPLGAVKELLDSKRFDYAGNPVEHMQDLSAAKVIPMWPKPGKAGVRCITEFLDPEVLEAVRDPSSWWLPDDRRPAKRTRSRVRATDETWFEICKAAHERNMMKVVSEDQLHKDRAGHYITNGAGGVLKRKEVNVRMTDFQRFISVLIPTNEHSEQLPGSQDSLPYVGQLTGIVLQAEDELYLDSEDLTSAFNLFAVPDTWLCHFAFSKRVDAAAFGGTPGVQVTPALSVVPMGWKSAVTLVQAAVRKIVFGMCKVPQATSVQKDRPLPGSRDLTVVYLDNFDELRRLRAFGEGLDQPTISDHHQKFLEVCDKLGLGRNEAKQLVMSLTGGIQGGELDGKTGVLKVAPDKLKNFIAISLGMLASEQWKEFHMRHWTGKAAFVAAFKRPLFAILEAMFPAIEQSTLQDVRPGAKELDEVLNFLVLSVTAEADLRAQVLTEVSCSDASPTGGGSAVAQRFKSQSLVMPGVVESDGKCTWCRRKLRSDEGRAQYPCPRRCGVRGCSVACSQAHANSGNCSRKSFSLVKFGERFSGPNFPLTKAVALEGGAVQKPMDILIKNNSWDFFTPEGKEALEEEEEDPALKWRHWGPNCRTFSKARGQPIYLHGKGMIRGPAQVRSAAVPWGFEKLNKDDQIKVRQDNKMAKRALKGLDTADRHGGYAALEHSYGSYLWFTPEAEDMAARPGWMYTTWSQCCFGGKRVKWTSLLHNSPRVHAALDTPECHCTHQEPYGVEWTEEGLRFDTHEEAEYPWAMCRAYARAVVADMQDFMLTPMGRAPVDLPHLLYSQIMGATRGIQSEDLVYKLIQGVTQMLSLMSEGNELAHLEHISRQVGLRGTDLRFVIPRDGTSERDVLIPYPAFRWYWKTALAFKWSSQQHINVLEMTAALAELRRRARKPSHLFHRYIHIVDSMVCYWALTKAGPLHLTSTESFDV